MVSAMVKVAEVEAARPQSSVAVKVTVAEPVAPQPSESPAKSSDHVTPPQSSVAVAPPRLASQAASCVALPAPSHSTTRSAAGVTSGGMVSAIVKVAEVEAARPQSSVAVKVTVAEPVAPQPSESPAKSSDHV